MVAHPKFRVFRVSLVINFTLNLVRHWHLALAQPHAPSHRTRRSIRIREYMFTSHEYNNFMLRHSQPPSQGAKSNDQPGSQKKNPGPSQPENKPWPILKWQPQPCTANECKTHERKNPNYKLEKV